MDLSLGGYNKNRVLKYRLFIFASCSSLGKFSARKSHLPVAVFVCTYIRRHTCVSVFPSACLSAACLSTCLSICLLVCIPAYLTAYLPPTCLYVCLSILLAALVQRWCSSRLRSIRNYLTKCTCMYYMRTDIASLQISHYLNTNTHTHTHTQS